MRGHPRDSAPTRPDPEPRSRVDATSPALEHPPALGEKRCGRALERRTALADQSGDLAAEVVSWCGHPRPQGPVCIHRDVTHSKSASQPRAQASIATSSKRRRCSSLNAWRGAMWAAISRRAGSTRPHKAHVAAARPASRCARSSPCSFRTVPSAAASVVSPAHSTGRPNRLSTTSSCTPSASRRRTPSSPDGGLTYRRPGDLSCPAGRGIRGTPARTPSKRRVRVPRRRPRL